MKSGTIHGLELFQSHNHTLDKVAKSLEEYLETKRAASRAFTSFQTKIFWMVKSKDPLVLPHCQARGPEQV